MTSGSGDVRRADPSGALADAVRCDHERMATAPGELSTAGGQESRRAILQNRVVDKKSIARSFGVQVDTHR